MKKNEIKINVICLFSVFPQNKIILLLFQCKKFQQFYSTKPPFLSLYLFFSHSDVCCVRGLKNISVFKHFKNNNLDVLWITKHNFFIFFVWLFMIMRLSQLSFFLDHNNNCIGHDKLIWHFHIILCSLNYFNISCYDIVNWIPVRTA